MFVFLGSLSYFLSRNSPSLLALLISTTLEKEFQEPHLAMLRVRFAAFQPPEKKVQAQELVAGGSSCEAAGFPSHHCLACKLMRMDKSHTPYALHIISLLLFNKPLSHFPCSFHPALHYLSWASRDLAVRHRGALKGIIVSR